MGPLPHAKGLALGILPIPPAILSIMGSTAIISSVVRSRQKGPYERILLGMSVCDIFMSVTLAFQPYLVEQHTSTFSIGNENTCRAIGTLFQFSSSSLFYYGALSYYYLLTVRYSFPKTRMGRRIEPSMHIVCIGWPLVTALAGAVVGFYDDLALFPGCWIDNYPKGCVGDECLAPTLSWVCSGAPLIFVMFSLIVNNVLIYKHVYKTYNRRRFTTTTFSGSTLAAQAQQDKRVRLVATQALLYVCAFFLTYLCFFILQILEANKMGRKKEMLYPLMVIQAILTPMAGFFNGVIYLRPRYIDIRKQFQTQTKVWSVRRALFGSTIQPVDAIDRPINPHVSLPPFGNDDRSNVVVDDDDNNYDNNTHHQNQTQDLTPDCLEKGKNSDSERSADHQETEADQTNQETEEGSSENVLPKDSSLKHDDTERHF